MSLGLGLTLGLPGCGLGPTLQGGLASFPPLANDRPPGASPAARSAAAALGRGVNFGNMLDAPQEGAWGLSVNEALISATLQGGFNSVRLPVRWSNHASISAPYALDEAFAARVESVVDSLLARGLWVVLDMHHYRQLDGDPLDAGEQAVALAEVELRYLMLWRQIAERFAGKSERLLFELYNEPHGRLTAAKWNDLAARALAVVRERNPSRIVVIGPASWNNADALAELRLPNDANLIATVHHYAPFSFTHQGAGWVKPALPMGINCCNFEQQAEIVRPLDVAGAWAIRSRYPVYLGEFGAYGSAELGARARYTRLVREAAEARSIPWAYWELAAGFGVYDPAAQAFRQPLLQALMGP